MRTKLKDTSAARGCSVPPDLGLCKRSRLSDGYAARLKKSGLAFENWARAERGVADPFSCRARPLDVLLGDFVTAVWRQDSERGYSLAVHAILEAQMRHPHLRGHLGTAWSRAWTWHLEKPLRMRVPFLEPIVDAIFIFALVNGFCIEPQLGHLWFPFAVLARMAFFGLLRPREGYALYRHHLLLPSQGWTGFARRLVVGISNSKNRAYMGKAQFAVVEDDIAIRWAEWLWSDYPPSWKLFPASGETFGAMLRKVLGQLGLAQAGFTPGSFRAGGATYWFMAGKGVDWVKFRGRWRALTTLEHYIQEGMATVVATRIDIKAQERLAAVADLFPALPEPPRDGWQLFAARPRRARKLG